MFGCTNQSTNKQKARLIVVDPQHFHAALVQKYRHDQIDSVVHLFAHDAKDVVGYHGLIAQYNGRENKPTNWGIVSYFGEDFASKAFTDNSEGNLLVLAGDNSKKIAYMQHATQSGLDVFADKPLVVDKVGYSKLKNLIIGEKNLIYDIMTERYDVKNEILKALILDEEFSGGFAENSPTPLITFSSTHHILKEVSGKPLVRPTLFFNTNRQGEGLVDVTTHYIDLVQWIVASEQVIDIEKNIQLQKATRWKTILSKDQFLKATNLIDFPKELSGSIHNNQLEIFSNGTIDYLFKNIPVSIAVQWKAEPTNGRGDQFYAQFSTRNVKFEVKADTQGKPSLFLYSKKRDSQFSEKIKKALAKTKKFVDVDMQFVDNQYQLIIPNYLYLSHEEHFTKVVDQFLKYRDRRKLPDWENSFLLAKYYLTTQALEKAETIASPQL